MFTLLSIGKLFLKKNQYKTDIIKIHVKHCRYKEKLTLIALNIIKNNILRPLNYWMEFKVHIIELLSI